MTRPTEATYGELQQAYDVFNGALFGDSLPACLIITVQRRRQTFGYLPGNRWQSRRGQAITDEIALNAAWFSLRSVEESLSTLVHEMTRLWQYHHGTPGRGRYHNAEWADKMESLGLMPTSTGEPGGKRTGDRVTHYILPDDTSARAAAKLLASGFDVTWADREPPRPTEAVPVRSAAMVKLKAAAPALDRTAATVKYNRPGCGINAWGKPSLPLIYGTCTSSLVPV